MSPSKVLKVIELRLEYHPGNAPWSCVECYHNRPCVDKEILLAAKAYLMLQKPKRVCNDECS